MLKPWKVLLNKRIKTKMYWNATYLVNIYVICIFVQNRNKNCYNSSKIKYKTRFEEENEQEEEEKYKEEEANVFPYYTYNGHTQNLLVLLNLNWLFRFLCNANVKCEWIFFECNYHKSFSFFAYLLPLFKPNRCFYDVRYINGQNIHFSV